MSRTEAGKLLDMDDPGTAPGVRLVKFLISSRRELGSSRLLALESFSAPAVDVTCVSLVLVTDPGTSKYDSPPSSSGVSTIDEGRDDCCSE